MQNYSISKSTVVTAIMGLALSGFLASSVSSSAYAGHLSEIQTIIAGPKRVEAFHEVLKRKNLRSLVERYRPVQAGLEWQRNWIRYEDGVTQFQFTVKPTQSSSSEAEDTSEGIWGYWSSIKSGISSAKDFVVNQTLQQVVGPIEGNVTIEAFECEAPYLKSGYQLKMSLEQSGSYVQSYIKGMNVTICLSDPEPNVEVAISTVSLKMEVVEGESFPGVDDPDVKAFALPHLEAWTESLSNAISRRQSSYFSVSH